MPYSLWIAGTAKASFRIFHVAALGDQLFHHVHQGAAGPLQVGGQQGQDAPLRRPAVLRAERGEEGPLVQRWPWHVVRAGDRSRGAAAGEVQIGLQPFQQHAPVAELADGQEGDALHRVHLFRIHAQGLEVGPVGGILFGVDPEQPQGALLEGAGTVHMERRVQQVLGNGCGHAAVATFGLPCVTGLLRP
jgi:hypothetical protein